MSRALCIDFGTSSLRAAFQNTEGAISPLPIGSVTGSRLDDASIRSDVLVDRSGSTVYFGEHAILRRVSKDGLWYDNSPKNWLREPAQLRLPICAETPLTKEALLIGVLANALHASMSAGRISLKEFSNIEIRVAHPIWPSQSAKQIDNAFRRILQVSRFAASGRKWGSVSSRDLLSISKVSKVADSKLSEVWEPIAAALTLMPERINSTQLCLVVDIGAGTTDIALFQGVTPDEASGKKSSLIRVGEARSLQVAGNNIDEALLALIKSKSKLSDVQIGELSSRSRQIKEILFLDGMIQEYGSEISLGSLTSCAALKEMALKIRELAEQVIQDAEPELKYRDRTHSSGYIEIVMGGGGSTLGFVQKALKRPFSICGSSVPVRFVQPRGHKYKLFGATIERMAVAIGGATDEYSQLKARYTDPVYYMRGPM